MTRPTRHNIKTCQTRLNIMLHQIRRNIMVLRDRAPQQPHVHLCTAATCACCSMLQMRPEKLTQTHMHTHTLLDTLQEGTGRTHAFKRSAFAHKHADTRTHACTHGDTHAHTPIG